MLNKLLKILRRECDRPPEGWHCTRKRGHDGPCAAVPDDPFWMNTMRHDVRDAAKEGAPTMTNHDHKAFEYWWANVPKINFAGTESEKNSAEAAWIKRAARDHYNTATAGCSSWEDWLASTPYRVRMMSGEGWYVERNNDGMYTMVTKPGEFYNYPQARDIAIDAALAAAIKEAGR